MNGSRPPPVEATDTTTSPLSLTFRRPREMEGLPSPTPAATGLPAWLKAMPPQATRALGGGEEDTVKRCPPFLDAMGAGFLMPLACDLRIEDGAISWESDLPAVEGANLPRSPLGFHDPCQIIGAPGFDPDQALIKFHSFWTIEAPEGWSILFTHPVNRFDLPFVTLTGLVDCDRYRDGFIHFPARWRDLSFRGVLPRGTPIAQVMPIRREAWIAHTDVLDPEALARTRDLTAAIVKARGVYRRRFRAPRP